VKHEQPKETTMKEVEKKDVTEIVGGEASTYVMPPATAYPIQPLPIEQPTDRLIVPEDPLP
jgi:hypothetical protein